ncbi:unnamed protein product [Sphenostylis stenocarpa]|uniref:Uncharacterized protein n=1 Tax=Sphenostylis stenocarpa TaxID=92480 RepID=A0AA86SGQ0_9FABA|nr:unnamed protein product [Sphenostylis stenocarpa]
MVVDGGGFGAGLSGAGVVEGVDGGGSERYTKIPVARVKGHLLAIPPECGAATHALIPPTHLLPLRALRLPQHDPTRVEHPTMHVLGTDSMPCFLCSCFVHGTNASIVTVFAVVALPLGSNHGTTKFPYTSPSPFSVGFPRCGKLVAWFTMDSKVPLARGFSLAPGACGGLHRHTR